MTVNTPLNTPILTVEDVPLDPTSPLIISDADEVILQFMLGLETFLHTQDLWIDLSSYAIHGNVKHKASNKPVPNERVTELIQTFFQTHTEHIDAVPGAADALSSLSEKAQVIVLSNVPGTARNARVRCLDRQGLSYPVVANSGPKGPAVATLASRMNAPIFFLDDIPHHITSVAQEAPEVHRIHVVADERLARLIEPAADSHHRIDQWPDIHAHINQEIEKFLAET